MRIIENETVGIKARKVFTGRFIGLFQLVILLTGCSVIPHERQQTAAIKSADTINASHDLAIEKAVSIQPPETIVWTPIPASQTNAAAPVSGGLAYTASVKVTSSARQQASEKGASEGHDSFTIPLGAKLALIAVSLGILVVVLIVGWRYVRTTAVGQGIALADAAIANRIRAIRSKIPLMPVDQQAQAHSEIADLEAERGRLVRQ